MSDTPTSDLVHELGLNFSLPDPVDANTMIKIRSLMNHHYTDLKVTQQKQPNGTYLLSAHPRISTPANLMFLKLKSRAKAGEYALKQALENGDEVLCKAQGHHGW